VHFEQAIARFESDFRGRDASFACRHARLIGLLTAWAARIGIERAISSLPAPASRPTIAAAPLSAALSATTTLVVTSSSAATASAAALSATATISTGVVATAAVLTATATAASAGTKLLLSHDSPKRNLAPSSE
jgi:hypothetical protein